MIIIINGDKKPITPNTATARLFFGLLVFLCLSLAGLVCLSIYGVFFQS